MPDPDGQPSGRSARLKPTRLAAFFGRVAEVYYSLTRLGGPAPPAGPVIFVANHPNGLVDPVLVGHVVQRRLLFLAKAPLFRIPVLGWLASRGGAIPVYRRQDDADTSANEEMFAAVHDALARGEAILLFPEGISHNEPELQPLKTGAARMALGAQAAHAWRLDVRIVPVGLTYRSKTRFQSSVAVEVGRPIATDDLRDAYAADPQAAARTLTARIAAGMREVTLNLENWQDLPLLRLAEQLIPDDGGHRVQRLRSFAEAGRRLEASNPAAMQRLRERLAVFHARLESGGLDIRHLEAGYAPRAVLLFVVTNLLALLIGLPLTLLGMLAWLPPYLLIRLAERLARPTPDIAATVKLLSALVFLGAWLAAAVAWLGSQHGPWAALAGLVLLPAAGFYARHFWRRRRRAWREAKIFFSLPFRGRQLALLTREAQRLRTELAALAAEIPRRSAK